MDTRISMIFFFFDVKGGWLNRHNWMGGTSSKSFLTHHSDSQGQASMFTIHAVRDSRGGCNNDTLARSLPSAGVCKVSSASILSSSK